MNPVGLHDDNHYTTAADLAILARYCMQNETFREIVKKPMYHIDPTNKYLPSRDLPSTNLFLSTARSSYHLYKPCTDKQRSMALHFFIRKYYTILFLKRQQFFTIILPFFATGDKNGRNVQKIIFGH